MIYEKISLRQIGNNVIVIIDDIKYSKITTKEEREILFKKIEIYNKINNNKLEKDIIKSLTPVKEKIQKEKEEKEIILKAKIKQSKNKLNQDKKIKKIIQKEKINFIDELKNKINNKEISQSELSELYNLIDKNKEINKNIKSIESRINRNGEY